MLRRSRHRIRLAYASALQESLDQTGAEGRQRQTVILAQNSPGCLWAATVTVFSGSAINELVLSVGFYYFEIMKIGQH